MGSCSREEPINLLPCCKEDLDEIVYHADLKILLDAQLCKHVLDEHEHEKRPAEKMLAVLDQLCRCAERRIELVKHAAGVAVVSKKILRVSEVASEMAVRILHSVVQFSTPAVLQEMLQVGAVSKLCLLLQVDYRMKVREKVKEMLRMHSRVWRSSPCLSSQLQDAPPTEGDFFVATHTSQKTNGPLDELSREYIDKMKERAGRDEYGNQLPLTNEIYRDVMPPERHGRVRLMGRGVTPTSLFGSETSSRGNSSSRIIELENEIAEMKRVTQEKEEERKHELDEIKRQAEEKEEERHRELSEIKKQAQEKEEERQREIDDMKRHLKSQNEEMEARLMQKVLEMTANYQ